MLKCDMDRSQLLISQRQTPTSTINFITASRTHKRLDHGQSPIPTALSNTRDRNGAGGGFRHCIR
ncbi:hypothetical protein CGCTS75_v002484 [Colletotrichum tropicale]|nr:hypothetical protein CGCTS75_v002484 [Colletotrichum tropicale]